MNLVKCELAHNKLKTYIKSSLAILVAMLVILLFVFCDEEIYNDIDTLLQSWPSMIYIVSLISMFAFSILSSVMYSRFVITEYSGKRAILIFSYPIKRSKVLATKCRIITVFAIASIIISNAVIYGIFLISSAISNSGKRIILTDSLIYMVQMLSLILVFAIIIGISSGYLGMVSNSVQTTIVSAIIFCVIATQIIGYIYSGEGVAMDYANLVVIVDVFMIVLSFVIYKMLEHKINVMELE